MGALDWPGGMAPWGPTITFATSTNVRSNAPFIIYGPPVAETRTGFARELAAFADECRKARGRGGWGLPVDVALASEPIPLPLPPPAPPTRPAWPVALRAFT